MWYIFTAGHRCRCFFDGIDNETSVYEADWLNRTVPVGHSVDQLNQCQRFNVTWEDIANGIDLSYSVIPCDRWIFDRSVFEETAATAVSPPSVSPPPPEPE